VTHEETTLDPSVDCHSDLHSEVNDTSLNIVGLLSIFDSFEEESRERLQRILIHVVNDTKLDKQEVKHSTFSCDTSVHLTKVVDGDFGLLGLSLLLLDLDGGSLSRLKTFNQLDVGENGVGISV